MSLFSAVLLLKVLLLEALLVELLFLSILLLEDFLLEDLIPEALLQLLHSASFFLLFSLPFESFVASVRAPQVRLETSLPLLWAPGIPLLELLLVFLQVQLLELLFLFLLSSAFLGPLPDHSGRQGLMGLSPLW